MSRVGNGQLERLGVVLKIGALLVAGMLAGAASAASHSQPAALQPAPHRCETLAGKWLGGAMIVGAKPDTPAGAGGDRCIVSGALHETLQFRVALPANWNGRLLYLGG